MPGYMSNIGILHLLIINYLYITQSQTLFYLINPHLSNLSEISIDLSVFPQS